MTWHEVQARVLEVQKEHQMCVHKRELTQLGTFTSLLLGLWAGGGGSGWGEGGVCWSFSFQ